MSDDVIVSNPTQLPAQDQEIREQARQMDESQLVEAIKSAQADIARADEQRRQEVAQMAGSVLLDPQAAAVVPPVQQPQQPAVAEPAPPQPTETPNAVPQAPDPNAVPTQPAKPAQVTFEELKAKTGVVNPDALATNFVELQRTLTKKSQELASIKRQQLQPQAPLQPAPVQPPHEEFVPQNVEGQLNEKFLQALATQPVATLKALVDSVLEPYQQTLAESNLKSEVSRLSAQHPDFNTDQVRGEMQRIISERYNDGYDITHNLEDVYWMARGRIGSNPVQTVPQNVAAPRTQQPAVNAMLRQAVVEGQSRPQAPTPFDPKTAPLEQVEKVLKNMMGQ